MFRFILFLILCAIIGCQSKNEISQDTEFEKALENGKLANEGYQRCVHYVEDWLKYADPVSGLIPRNLNESVDIWNAKDAAADNYPFMVLTAAITDKELLEGKMRQILDTEQKLTNRLDRLPDTYSFSKRGFNEENIDLDEIIFGSSEYIKDGLLPLIEYIGDSPWSIRMIEILDDIWKNASYPSPFGKIPSTNVEVNGELLQALSRVYWMTGKEKYLSWAITLGDYYLLGDQHPTENQSILRLRDHGCEIISGLCELYIATAYALPEKREAYRPAIYQMMDRILEVGINEDGLFYNQINPVSGEILDAAIADTWGYTYNAYYGLYMLDQHEPYKKAVVKAMGNLDKYQNFNWENHSADGYADAIESAINLYNREIVPNVEQWIDSQMQVMWSMQDSAHRSGSAQWQNTGIIEGWHGDGNFARTTIMYNLWKTQGVTIAPWSSSVIYGAEKTSNTIRLALYAKEAWTGKIQFDVARHKEFFNLPIDYPRINQFPEWFVIDKNSKYRVTNRTTQSAREWQGNELIDGMVYSLDKEEKVYFEIEEVNN